MELQISNGSALAVSDKAFGADFREPLVHQVVTAVLAGARAGTRAQKTRSDVRGGGKKPWRQKGSGRARAGTIRSPIWRGGGKSFAARPQDHSQKVNKKMYRGALASLLSELVRQDRLIVVDEFKLASHRTRDLLARLDELGLKDVLIVTEAPEDNLYLASRNLYHVGVCAPHQADPVSLIGFEKVLMTVAAVKQFEEHLG